MEYLISPKDILILPDRHSCVEMGPYVSCISNSITMILHFMGLGLCLWRHLCTVSEAFLAPGKSVCDPSVRGFWPTVSSGVGGGSFKTGRGGHCILSLYKQRKFILTICPFFKWEIAKCPLGDKMDPWLRTISLEQSATGDKFSGQVATWSQTKLEESHGKKRKLCL